MDTASFPISLLVADDHPLFRQGLVSVLEGEDDIRLIGEASTGQEAILLHRALRPTITLMDIQMPDMNGIEATRLIKRDFPDARVVVLTTYQGDMHAIRAIKAGAVGYVLKSTVRKKLLDTLRLVAAGGTSLPHSLASSLAFQVPADTLSSREIQVLELAARGHTNRLIGKQLGITEETTKAHMRNVLAKLGANDRTHAVMMAVERGIIDVRQSPL